MKNHFICFHYKVVFFILIMLTSCSSSNPTTKFASQILYTQLNWDTNTSAWIFNVDDGRKWKIDDDLWAREWSPSGKSILLDGNGQIRQGQIWVSSSDGTNLSKVFDAKDYPEITPFFSDAFVGFSHKSFWLTDTIILIQPQNGPIILYDIVQKKIVEVRKGAVLEDVSPGGEYWIEVQLSSPLKYFLASLRTIPLELPQYGLEYYDHDITGGGAKIAYSIKKDSGYYVAVSNIDPQKGMYEEVLLTPPSSGRGARFRWDSSQQNLLYKFYDTTNNQLKCIVINVPDKKEIYNRPCESRADVLLWSPRSDGFLIQPGMKNHFFYHLDGSMETILQVSPETEGSYQIVDWRLIEVP